MSSGTKASRAPEVARTGSAQKESRRAQPRDLALHERLGNRGTLAVLEALRGANARAKLAVSAPADPAEREADRAADAMMRGAPAKVGGSSCAPGSSCCTSCASEEPVAREAEGSATPAASASFAAGVDALRGRGDPLPAEERAHFAPRLGHDLDDVRVHTGTRAAELAAEVQAHAFTTGNDIFFGAGRYQPGAHASRRLLAHELVHVAQQSHGEPAKVQRSPASDLIDAHTSWANLDEAALGTALADEARAGRYDFVQNVLDELGSTDRDDVAFEMMTGVTDEDLTTIVAADRGRLMLDRLYDELTAGSVAEEETAQADRIIQVKSQRISVTDFAAGIEHAKVFPFRLPGFTVMDDAPITAERRGEGRIYVTMPVRVLGTDAFRAETATLPTEVFTSGIELPENEIVGVRLYDLGGEVIFRPALYLVQLSNQTDTTILEKVVEAAAIGATLGSGSLFAGAAEATLTARVLLWADRIAFVLGTLTSLIREHRGWIIEQFGEEGRSFLRAVDVVNSVVAIYGVTRAVIGAGQIFASLRRTYVDWRAAARAADATLSDADRSVVQGVASSADEVLSDAQRIEMSQPRSPRTPASAEPPAEGGAIEAPSVEEPAATGPTAERPVPAEPGGVPEAEADVGALGRRTTADGAHELKATATGELVCCSPICARLRDRYADAITAGSALDRELTAIERRIAPATRTRNLDEIRAALADAVLVEGRLSSGAFLRIKAAFPAFTDAHIASLQRLGIDAITFQELLDAGRAVGLTIEDAMLIAETGGWLGVRNASVALRAPGGTLSDAFDAAMAAEGTQPGIRPPRSVTRFPERVTLFRGATVDEAYAAALENARLESGLGANDIPFLQELGPRAGQVSGRMAADGSHGWRLDFDPNPPKGFHINWWRLDARGFHQGANVVVGGNEESYIQMLARLNGGGS